MQQSLVFVAVVILIIIITVYRIVGYLHDVVAIESAGPSDACITWLEKRRGAIGDCEAAYLAVAAAQTESAGACPAAAARDGPYATYLAARRCPVL